MVDAALFSSATGEWSTPQNEYEKWNSEYHFDLDAAATAANTKCERWLGPGSSIATDALEVDWSLHGRNIWLNPPYGSTIGLFLYKAWEASMKGSTVVCLLPARTDTKWWHDYCEPLPPECKTFLKGRLKFGGAKNSAPFPSVVVIFPGARLELPDVPRGESRLIVGDCRRTLLRLPEKSVQCCVTSPPYFGLRDYGTEGQIGNEDLDEYIQQLVEVFRCVREVLKDDGTLWLNLGDSYANTVSGGTKVQGNPEFNKNRPSRQATKLGKKSVPDGLKAKDLIGVPWRVALALQADGWYLRSDVVWHKPNPMPESVKDRPTRSHEYLFLFTKAAKYFYDADAVREPYSAADKNLGYKLGGIRAEERNDHGSDKPRDDFYKYAGRNKRTVWTITPATFKGAHFATFPPKLIEPCVLAGSRPGDLILDPFSGAATTGLVACGNGRNYVGIELNPDYVDIAERRLKEHGILATKEAW